jgi:hypothetical protein
MTTTRRGNLRRLLFLGSVVCSSSISAQGHAYRTIGDLPEYGGARIRWPDSAMTFEVHSQVPDSLPIGSLVETSQRALEAWSNVGCTDVQAYYLGLSDSPAQAGDGRNTIQVITTGWEALGYEPDALGATELEIQRNDDTWEIAEADILINAVYHRFALVDAPVDGTRSLLGTLRHEGGHALGLLHPCETDHSEGAPICDEATTSAATLMYPFYDAAQTELSSDDTAAICHLYPSCNIDGCPDGWTCTDTGCQQQCADTLCEPGKLCFDDACVSFEDCESDAECSGSTTPDSVVSCNVTDTCETGLCLPDGTCALPCITDTECPESRCVFSSEAEETGYCAPVPPKGLGERCSESDECAEGQCLAGAERTPVCTRACGDGEAQCPSGWTCSGVDGRSVCVPPREGRGCAVASISRPEGRQSASDAFGYILILVAIVIRRRRLSSHRVQLRSVSGRATS